MGRNVTNVGREKKEDNKELKKHAATIHCSNTLSLLQRKITNALLYHAYKDLLLKEEHEIGIKQLCRLIGYQGHNHGAIKEALKVLISTVIEWNIIHDGTGSENWTASSMIASVSLQGPICYYAYSPRMKQLLHSPSMFGKINLVIQSRFRSSYGLALYENCIRYCGLPHTKWFDIDIFKKLMGVSSEKYDIFRDFKRRVLDKAVDEVNTYSDLVIAPEFVREGRRVLKVRFQLKERAKKTRLGGTSVLKTVTDPSIADLKQKLLAHYGLSADQIEQLLTEYAAHFVAEKMAVIEASKPYQEGKIVNLAGYLQSAIKNNYQLVKAKPNQPDSSQEIKREFEFSLLKRQVEAIREDYQAYREKTIHELIDSLAPAAKSRLLDQFFQFAAPTMDTILRLQRNKYSVENILESPQIQALLRQFALRELDSLSLCSLEEFVAQLNEQVREAWQKLKAYDPDHALLQFSE